MANYLLHTYQKGGTTLFPSTTLQTQPQSAYYLSDSLERLPNGSVMCYYRLHTRDYHTLEDTFQFDILCPKCKQRLKPYNIQSDGYTHSWYHCPNCKKGLEE